MRAARRLACSDISNRRLRTAPGTITISPTSLCQAFVGLEAGQISRVDHSMHGPARDRQQNHQPPRNKCIVQMPLQQAQMPRSVMLDTTFRPLQMATLPALYNSTSALARSISISQLSLPSTHGPARDHPVLVVGVAGERMPKSWSAATSGVADGEHTQGGVSE